VHGNHVCRQQRELGGCQKMSQSIPRSSMWALGWYWELMVNGFGLGAQRLFAWWICWMRPRAEASRALLTVVSFLFLNQSLCKFMLWNGCIWMGNIGYKDNVDYSPAAPSVFLSRNLLFHQFLLTDYSSYPTHWWCGNWNSKRNGSISDYLTLDGCCFIQAGRVSGLQRSLSMLRKP